MPERRKILGPQAPNMVFLINLNPVPKFCSLYLSHTNLNHPGSTVSFISPLFSPGRHKVSYDHPVPTDSISCEAKMSRDFATGIHLYLYHFCTVGQVIPHMFPYPKLLACAVKNYIKKNNLLCCSFYD